MTARRKRRAPTHPSQSYADRKATGRKATLVWFDETTLSALARISELRGYTVRRDALAWAIKVGLMVAEERESAETLP